MDIRFALHNTHIDNPEKFEELDPHLRNLKKHPLVFLSPLLKKLPKVVPGIYTLSGGRQIGKTTLLKQWMQSCLQEGISQKSILFLTGEIIDNHHILISTIQNLLSEDFPEGIKILIIDEVSYIKEWDKGIKYLADSGVLEETILLLTGSDMGFLKEARMRFPGRRGISDVQDYHLYPLSFREFMDLTQTLDDPSFQLDELYNSFENYLIHGGYLTAMNDILVHGNILKSTMTTYSDWIRGDILKKGKKESFLNEILKTLINSYGSQVTWNSLAQHLSIQHPKTVHEYCEALATMDALFIQDALLEHKLQAAPKKAKKLHFTDPFIFRAVHEWGFPSKVIPSKYTPFLVESIVVNHFQRLYPTYYIKSASEVDIAYIKENTFWPLEVKWTTQIRPQDLKQISKYKNGIVLTKAKKSMKGSGLTSYPLPLFLYQLK